jgi:hypothetical protein
MRAITVVLRILLAAYVGLVLTYSAVRADGHGAAVVVVQKLSDQHSGPCDGIRSGHSCCQSLCAGCFSPVAGSRLRPARLRDCLLPAAPPEPSSLATGGIERPPRGV